MTWDLPKGVEYLPEYSIKDLNELYKAEKNSKAKVRLLAAIFRKEGKALREIGDLIGYAFNTVRDWLVRMHKFGLDSRYNKKQPGKVPKLKKEDLTKLDEILDNPPEKQGIPFTLWTTQLTQYIIYEKFGILFTPRHVRRIVKKINFSFQIPRQEHRKANKKLQEKFKVELKKKFNIMLNLDSRSSVLTKHTSS